MPLSSACEKMSKNKAYPSDTAYFFGMTKEENDSLAHPYPPIAQCQVTVHADGGITLVSNPPHTRKAPITPDFLVRQALRKTGVDREQAHIVWSGS